MKNGKSTSKTATASKKKIEVKRVKVTKVASPTLASNPPIFRLSGNHNETLLMK